MLAVLLGQCLYFAVDNGQAVDETFYNGSGYPIVRYNDYRILGEHPPLVMQLGSLPLLFFQPHYPLDQPVMLGNSGLFDVSKMGSKFLYGMGNDASKILFWERFAVILLALLLGLVLFVWADSIYGFAGAALSLTLYAFCPNVITHGSLFTTDMAVTLFIFLAVYAMRRFFGSLRVRDAVFSGVICGLALISKISSLVLLPISLALFGAFAFWGKPANFPQVSPKKITFAMVLLAVLLFVFAAGQKMMLAMIGPACVLMVQLVVIARGKISRWVRFAIVAAGWIACLVSAVLLTKKSGLLISAGLAGWCGAVFACAWWLTGRKGGEKFRGLGLMFVLLWLVAAAVIVLGYTDFPRTILRLRPFAHYVNTFNIATTNAQSMHKVCVPNSFISCDWRYFLGVMAIKTPLVSLFLFGAGLLILPFTRISKLDKFCMIMPPVFFWLIASFVNRINIGLRHVLPIYPFMFLIAGCVGYGIAKIRRKSIRLSLMTLLAVAIVYYGGNSLKNLPHHISYFNELIGSAENGARFTSDSNVNWGQDNKRLAAWVKANGIGEIGMSGTCMNFPELTYFGIRWRVMNESDFESPADGYYAVDIEQYQALQRRSSSWFRGRQPYAKIGKTIYVFRKEPI